MEIKTRQIDDKPLTIIIEYPTLDAKTKRLIKKLYEFEEMFRETGIIRISKSCLMNMDMLYSIKPLTNSQLEATLLNGEKLIVARTYLKSIKNILKEDVRW